ncbi:ISAzo13-like element transposase-related protein, partial [Trichormus azollae]|uniref:ISAzo13-like element transposase-related protein n=1 Tax=Trichormus azollae TaxID=1164 RepID=UPI00325E0ACE
FTQDLQALVNELGMEIPIPHYPSYNSKYNPIRHSFFPRICPLCQGLIFESVQTVEDLMTTVTPELDSNS